MVEPSVSELTGQVSLKYSLWDGPLKNSLITGVWLLRGVLIRMQD